MIHYAAHAEYVFFYIFASLAAVGNLLVLISLWSIKKSKTCFTHLLYYLHTSAFMMAILSYPYVYKGSDNFCRTIQGFECYFALVNLITVALLIEAHRSNIFECSFDIKRLIHEKGRYLILSFPLLVFLGFASGAYQTTNDAFCLIEANFNEAAFLSLYLIWVWMIIIFCIGRIANTLYRIYVIDKLLAKRFFTSLGMYIFVALFTWIPRTIVRFFNRLDDPNDDDNQYQNSLFLISLFPVQIGGILYACIYLKEVGSLKLLENNRNSINVSRDGDDGGFSFSWDEIITNDMLIRGSNATISNDGPNNYRFSAALNMWANRPTVTRLTPSIPLQAPGSQTNPILINSNQIDPILLLTGAQSRPLSGISSPVIDPKSSTP